MANILNSSISDPAGDDDGDSSEFISAEAQALIDRLGGDDNSDSLFSDEDDSDDIDDLLVTPTKDSKADNVDEEDEADDEDVTADVPEEKVKALEEGWTDKDDWIAGGKDPDQWIDYKEFNFRGSLYRKIEQQKNELKQTKYAFKKELRDFMKGLKQTKADDVMASFESKANQLKLQYREAKESGNIADALEIRDRLDDLLDKADETKKKFSEDLSKETPDDDEDADDKSPEALLKKVDPAVAQSIKESVNEFLVANKSWYQVDPALTLHADNLLAAKLVNRTVVSAAEQRKLLAEVATEVRTAFAAHALFKKRARADNPVTTGGKGDNTPLNKASSVKAAFDALPPLAKKMAKNFARDGVMSIEDYIKEYNEG